MHKARVRSRYLKGFHHYVGRSKVTRKRAARAARYAARRATRRA